MPAEIHKASATAEQVRPYTQSNPFDLAQERAYQAWRSRKLDLYQAALTDLLVEVRDPQQLNRAEHAALLSRCRAANMAIYQSTNLSADKELVRALGMQLGLSQLDANRYADEDAISAIAAADAGGKQRYIPYTTRAIQWHTDGYYNRPEQQVQAVILHCVRPAPDGGSNALLDHEIAYILLRDANPEYIQALMAPDAMTIPADDNEQGGPRPACSGPVFSVTPSGHLHMRYTRRKRSISWRDDAITQAAVTALEALFDTPDLPYVLRTTLQAGQGLICNNVLHDRSAFSNGETTPQQRLLYRARYYQRIAG